MPLMRVLVPLLFVALGGCATVNHMAFDRNATSVDVSTKSVVLLTIEVSRPDKSRFEPVPFIIYVEKPNAQNQADRQNFVLSKDKDAMAPEGGPTVFLARIALAPGPYKLMAVSGFARAFPINGFFLVPLIDDFTVAPRSITYLGRVTATLRPRQGDEFRAGPVIPLIDQAVAGLSMSSWDVAQTDHSSEDIPIFQHAFRAIETANIVSAPLPPFDRAKAQRWWEGNSAKEAEKAPPLKAATGSN